MFEDKKEETVVTEEETVTESKETKKEEVKEPSKKEKKEKILKKIEDLEKQNAELKDKLLRNSAELANFKRRINEERITDRKYASMDLISNLIGQLENLRMVSNMPTDDPMLKNFLIGFKMISDQLFDILGKDGLKEIPTLNKKFDPNYHKAIETIVTDEFEENTVIDEVQKGYTYKDRVLRCANVKVSKKSN